MFTLVKHKDKGAYNTLLILSWASCIGIQGAKDTANEVKVEQKELGNRVFQLNYPFSAGK